MLTSFKNRLFQKIRMFLGSSSQNFQVSPNHKRASRSLLRQVPRIFIFCDNVVQKSTFWGPIAFLCWDPIFYAFWGRFWLHFGSILEPSGVALGSIWALWGAFGLHLGSLVRHLGSIWRLWGHFWTSREQEVCPKSSLV